MIPPEDNRITMHTIASAIGVSRVTVSLALRNSPKISLARRQEIQALALKLGYRRNAAATALVSHRRTATIPPIKAGLAWLNQWPSQRELRSYKEFDRYWLGAYNAAEKFGYRLEEFGCGQQMPLTRVQEILLARGIYGVLLPPHPYGVHWNGFQWERFAAVRFGRSIPNLRLHLVTSDQVSNTMLAFERIQQRGYRRIGFVTGHASGTGALFTAGFVMAQRTMPRALQLPICTLDNRSRSLRDGAPLSRWLRSAKPDAILTDVLETRDLLAKIGCQVPGDVGLAALSILDGNADAGIDQNPEEIGRVAVLLTLSLLNDNAMGVPSIFRQSLVEGFWIDGSTLPPR